MSLTPEQFNKLATKDDLKEFKEEIKEETVSKVEFNKMMTTIDGIAKNVKDIKEEKTANQGAHDRMQGGINNNSKRINKLELKTA